jgi:predicted RNase H-like HicB family nuclease
VVAADSYDETVALIREAIEFHVEGMRMNGEVVPSPTTATQYVDVA